MQKTKRKFFFQRSGVLIFVLFIGILLNYNVISINESNNESVINKFNYYSPGSISSSLSEKLKGLIAKDLVTGPDFYYGPYNYDMSSETCCEYTDWDIELIEIAEGYKCDPSTFPVTNKDYHRQSCVMINRKEYIKNKTRYCKSTQNRSETEPIGNTVQYKDWDFTNACGPWIKIIWTNRNIPIGIVTYGNLEKIDEYNARISKYTKEKVSKDEYYSYVSECTPHRDPKICGGSNPPECDPTKEVCDPTEQQQYCYDADSPLLSYYQEYMKNPTAANWEKFIGTGSGQHNCCQPLVSDPKLREDYIDSLGNNIYKTYCTKPIKKVCFNEENSYEYEYEKDKTNEANKKAYQDNCCKNLDAKKEMGDEYITLCPDENPEPPKCFTGNNSYKEQYAKGKITAKEYSEKCCDNKDANTQNGMGEDYPTFCPSKCFIGENSYKEQNSKGNLSDADYAIKCCSEDGAESNLGMGSRYPILCPTPKPKCFTGENSYKEQYNNGLITATQYAIYCCNEIDANSPSGMGSQYKPLCTSSCDPKVSPTACSQDSDSGFIYEAGEKGVTSDNKLCLLNSPNDSTNDFIQFGFEGNKYCRVLCKEDAEFYYPGFGYNPSSNNPYLIKAGQYFKFKPYIDSKLEKEFLPSVNQSRTCVVQSFPNTFSTDLLGSSDFNASGSTGYYARAEAALKAYYNLTNLVNSTSNPHYKKEYETQRQVAASSYRYNTRKINEAINQYNQCISWTNQYESEDYPKIEDFWYSEMSTKNKTVAESLKKLKVEIKNQKIIDSQVEYCDEGLNICGGTLIYKNIPTFKNVTLPSNVSGSKQDFINSYKETPVNMGFFYNKKSYTEIEIDYTLGSELYAIKPNGLTVDEESPIFQTVSGRYTFNRIGYGLPVNFDTFGGKRYNYQFTIKNIGKKDGNLMTLYKEVQQDQTPGTDSVYVCHYEVANEIICPKSACPINCADPLNCGGDDTPISDPTLQTIFRPISNDDINPNDRELGSNWSDEKGLAAKERIEEMGDNIYAETPQYSFVLDANLILEIKRYNDEHSYGDFEMICSQDSDKCRSDFVTNYAEAMSENWIEYNETTKKFVIER